jgi:hypothetical protein
VTKEIDLKTALVLGPKFMKYLKELAALTGLGEQEVVKRALAMYREIKLKEKEGYKPCMLKDRTARLLQEK